MEEVVSMGDISNYLSVVEFAKVRGVTRQAISENIRNGRIKAEKIAGVWLIPKSQIEENTIRKIVCARGGAV